MTIVNEADRDATVIAAFDVGSNSIKMTVGRRAGNGVEATLQRSETVRLGEGIDRTGRLADDRIAAALDALGRFTADARAAGATRQLGVATEATRVATNGQAFLETVHDRFGIELTTITGDREAELTHRGLHGLVDLSGRVVIADIGGASTEIILAADDDVTWSHSFALGSGRLTDRFVDSDPPTTAELQRCRDAAADTLAPAPFTDACDRLIVVGGTGEYLDRLVPAAAARDAATLEAILQRLTVVRAARLAVQLSIAEARARVLPAGVAIARAVAEQAVPRTFVAAQSGIRRGLLLAAFAGEI